MITDYVGDLIAEYAAVAAAHPRASAYPPTSKQLADYAQRKVRGVARRKAREARIEVLRRGDLFAKASLAQHRRRAYEALKEAALNQPNPTPEILWALRRCSYRLGL